MKKTMCCRFLCIVLASLAVALAPMHEAQACTRAVYLGPEDTIITVTQHGLERRHWQPTFGLSRAA